VALVHLRNDPVFGTVIPSKIFEAMGMGLPILLVSPPGEAREIVEGEGAGAWVPAGAPDALAAAVRALRNDGARRARLAAASLAAAPRHTRRRQADEMLDVFRHALADV
jgi:glycosyltransferase involved in cell wall biosynthesis